MVKQVTCWQPLKVLLGISFDRAAEGATEVGYGRAEDGSGGHTKQFQEEGAEAHCSLLPTPLGFGAGQALKSV